MKKIYLKIEELNLLLENEATIISYPSKKRSFYICSLAGVKHKIYIV